MSSLLFFQLLNLDYAYLIICTKKLKNKILSLLFILFVIFKTNLHNSFKLFLKLNDDDTVSGHHYLSLRMFLNINHSRTFYGAHQYQYPNY